MQRAMDIKKRRTEQEVVKPPPGQSQPTPSPVLTLKVWLDRPQDNPSAQHTTELYERFIEPDDRVTIRSGKGSSS